MTPVTLSHIVVQRVLALLDEPSTPWYRHSSSDSCLRHRSGLCLVVDLNGSDAPAHISICTPDESWFTYTIPGAGFFSNGREDDRFATAVRRVRARLDAETVRNGYGIPEPTRAP